MQKIENPLNHLLLLSELLNIMPRCAEEGSLEVIRTRSGIERHLIEVNGVPTAIVHMLIGLIERLFDSLALLDRIQLQNGAWRLVSFPAQLVAYSLLNTLCDNQQDLLPLHYWEVGAHRPADAVEAQRSILIALENARFKNHRKNRASPVRHIYVAWGVIKIGDQFLLRHREDVARKGAGNFVLPGGRFNHMDIPIDQQPEDLLLEMQRGQSSLVHQYLSQTLARELSEETSLEPEHYSAKLWKKLEPYTKVEGAKSNHAFTSYEIVIYTLELTAHGLMTLMNRIAAAPQDFELFSPEDLAKGQNAAGKTVFLDAMREHFKTPQRMIDALRKAPESFTCSYQFDKDTDSVEIPLAQDSNLLIGKTGKERAIPVSLTQREREWLWGLSAHTLAHPVVYSEVITPLKFFGWLRIEDEAAQKELSTLAAKLNTHQARMIDLIDLSYARLNIAPAHLFLDSSAYRYELTHQDGAPQITLNLPSASTPIGDIPAQQWKAGLTLHLHNVFLELHKRNDRKAAVLYDAADTKRMIMMHIDEPFKTSGLRKLVRTKQGSPFLACNPTAP